MIPAVNVRVHDAYVTGEGLLQSVLGAYRRAPVSWNAYRSKSHAVTSPHIRYKYSAQKPSKFTACRCWSYPGRSKPCVSEQFDG